MSFYLELMELTNGLICPQPKRKPAAKRAAPAKPAAKTKKADSSSNKQKKTANKGNGKNM